jgi:serine/threonine protein kinase
LRHVLRQLKGALDELRAHDVVHGDLHPGNLMFKPRNVKIKLASQLEVQLIDFGLHKTLAGELSGGVPFYALFGWVESLDDDVEGYLGALRTCGMKATCCDEFGAIQTVMKLLATLDKTGEARQILNKIQSTRPPDDDALYDAEYEGFRYHMGVEWLKSDQSWITFWLEHEGSVCAGPNEEWPEVHERYCKFIRSVVPWKGACAGTILSFVELFNFPRPPWEAISSAMKKRQSRKRSYIFIK